MEFHFASCLDGSSRKTNDGNRATHLKSKLAKSTKPIHIPLDIDDEEGTNCNNDKPCRKKLSAMTTFKGKRCDIFADTSSDRDSNDSNTIKKKNTYTDVTQTLPTKRAPSVTKN